LWTEDPPYTPEEPLPNVVGLYDDGESLALEEYALSPP